MQISVKHNILSVMPKLEQFTSRQAPFAIAKALTSTAKLVQAEMGQKLPTSFERPTAFTQRAFSLKGARKDALVAIVFAKDAQARYLKFGVQGGGRRATGYEKKFDSMGERRAAFMVPTRNVKKNSQGNVPISTFGRIGANLMGPKARYFIGKPENDRRSYGVYERMRNGSLKALFVERKTQPVYKTKLDMPTIGRRVIATQFDNELRKAWAQAMATAR